MRVIATLAVFLLAGCAEGPLGGLIQPTHPATPAEPAPAAEPAVSFQPGATPAVDRGQPQLYTFQFRADNADPAATAALGRQLAFLDTRATPVGKLVVHLHGAGNFPICGSREHGRMLAGLGFHVFSPCYRSDYGVDNCGAEIGRCRLEAFEGVDHHPFIEIDPADSIEGRVVAGLRLMQQLNPQGDWVFFVDGERPRWDRIIISGLSHGASTAAVIGKHRQVARVVMLSGPFDRGQAWLTEPSQTPMERFHGFTHTSDRQHPGHLEAFAALELPGEPLVVDGSRPPYLGSHRLVSEAETDNGHRATEASAPSPRGDNGYAYLPVWRTLYGL